MVVSEATKTRISSELSESGDVLTIRISGNFDFNLHREFQRAYQNPTPSPRCFSIDLSETLYLDSAALGMLLLLRDYCKDADSGECSSRIELLNPGDHVANILAVSNFDKIFTIRQG